MLFLIDEDMPRSTAKILARAGYRAIDVRDTGLRGAQDRDIFAFACQTITQTNELLLTSLHVLREDDIVGNIVVMEPKKIRIRKRRAKTS